MQHENTKPRISASTRHISSRSLNIFLQLLNCILQRCACVVHLIHNQYVFANETRHLQCRQVEPLGTGDFCSRRFDRLGWVAARGEGFVEGKADGLDGNIGRGGAFEEGTVCCQRDFVYAGREEEGSYGGGGKVPEYSGWDISSSSDGNHEIRLKLIEDVFGGCLAEFVDLRFDHLAAIPSTSPLEVPHASGHILSHQEEREG